MEVVTRFPSLTTPLCEKLGCEVPIMLAGMGGVARHRLVASVTSGGGFGVLGMVREPVEFIRTEILALRECGCVNFGVNLIPCATESELLKQQIAICMELEVPWISLFWDVDVKLIRYLKSAGIGVIHQVGDCWDADLAITAGADVLIAQGIEAGGHVRGEQSVITLVQELVELTNTPVVAAGCTASGLGLVAMMMLGAQGVSMGTPFLATIESNAHDFHKRRIIDASSKDTVYTRQFRLNWHEPAPVRVLANEVTRGEFSHEEHTDERRVIGRQDGRDIYLFSTDSPLKGAEGDLELMALYAGHSCDRVDDIIHAASRIETICSEAERIIQILQ